jgi:hypothetical protein
MNEEEIQRQPSWRFFHLHQQHGHRAAQHQHAGQADHILRIPAQQAAVVQRQREDLDDHRDHDEHIEDAHVDAGALRRNAARQHHIRIAHDAGPRQPDAHHRHNSNAGV